MDITATLLNFLLRIGWGAPQIERHPVYARQAVFLNWCCKYGVTCYSSLFAIYTAPVSARWLFETVMECDMLMTFPGWSINATSWGENFLGAR